MSFDLVFEILTRAALFSIDSISINLWVIEYIAQCSSMQPVIFDSVIFLLQTFYKKIKWFFFSKIGIQSSIMRMKIEPKVTSFLEGNASD
jgi:hypothetical protein